jgi:hypothetical protein
MPGMEMHRAPDAAFPAVPGRVRRASAAWCPLDDPRARSEKARERFGPGERKWPGFSPAGGEGEFRPEERPGPASARSWMCGIRIGPGAGWALPEGRDKTSRAHRAEGPDPRPGHARGYAPHHCAREACWTRWTDLRPQGCRPWRKACPRAGHPRGALRDADGRSRGRNDVPRPEGGEAHDARSQGAPRGIPPVRRVNHRAGLQTRIVPEAS